MSLTQTILSRTAVEPELLSDTEIQTTSDFRRENEYDDHRNKHCEAGSFACSKRGWKRYPVGGGL